MTTSNWSRIGYIIGLIISILFAVRYLVMWPDYSQAIIFVGLGLTIMAFSWVYEKILQINETLALIEDYLGERPWKA